jgi:hypothetical protein
VRIRRGNPREPTKQGRPTLHFVDIYRRIDDEALGLSSGFSAGLPVLPPPVLPFPGWGCSRHRASVLPTLLRCALLS